MCSNFSTQMQGDNVNEDEDAIHDFLKKDTLKYFLMEYKYLGNAFLYASSYFPEHRVNLSYFRNNVVNFNLLLGRFLYKLTRSLHKQFIQIMKDMKGYMLNNPSEEVPVFGLKIPVTLPSLRTTYLDGKHSFLQHVPLPIIDVVDSDSGSYSYTTLLECLTHFLAFGHGVRDINSAKGNTSFDHCKLVDELHKSRSAFEKKRIALEVHSERNNHNHPKFITFFRFSAMRLTLPFLWSS